MYLTGTVETLQIVLAGAVTTNESVVTVDYGENTSTTFVAGKQRSVTNGASSVDILSAPAASTQRIVQLLTMTNQDTAPITVTIRTNNAGALATQCGPITLQVGERLQFATDTGFTVYTVTGAVKVTAVASTVEPGYIDGLNPVWVSGTAITVTSGTCYIPSSGFNINFPSPIAKSGLSLSANTWYHIYAFLNSGVPDIEIVTTAPSSVYNGSARTKSGDTTRRYLGSARTDGSSVFYNFIKNGNVISYRFDIASVSRVLSNGVSTTQANVSFTGFVPETARLAVFRAINTSSNIATIYVYDDASSPAYISYISADPSPTGSVFSQVYTAALSPTQIIQYAYASGISAGGFYLDAIGYIQDR